MSDKTVKANLTGTFTWGGKKYGPGEDVSVPVKMAEWLGQADSPEEADTATTPAKAPAKK